VLYLSEDPEHAVAESLQHYRGQTIADAELHVGGFRLALGMVDPEAALANEIVDLCDPRVLDQLELGPDETASRDRRKTRHIAAMIHAAGRSGLRWWSALAGDWHTVVVFVDRAEGRLAFHEPEPLTLRHLVLRRAAHELGLRLSR
jgi:hypothetical protein